MKINGARVLKWFDSSKAVLGFVTLTAPVFYSIGYYSNFFEKDRVIQDLQSDKQQLQEQKIELTTKINELSFSAGSANLSFEREKLKYERTINNLQDSLKDANK